MRKAFLSPQIMAGRAYRLRSAARLGAFLTRN
jgi:hypothetical protein